ncbi:Aspartate aminotransferase [Bosea sp. LC85]|uniref:aminotransferase-like domain-containing protein n=1 Tax=Bosea sp. LC85 TaxID=1502851 RepID=UPI0004E3251E|nr:PLP-dependent aminotransferase family protein [Bosea sp. LC85]KFC66851.1 Aspartate aminotransferase [Bosea sp. LC85]
MDEKADSTHRERIVGRIGRSIDDGLLQPGRRMPSLRAAAEEYGVSKNTMVEAYDRLVALGRLEARRGSGFYVRAGGRNTIEAPPQHMTEAIDIVSLLREQLCQTHPVRVGDGRPPASWTEDSELGRHLRPRSGKGLLPIEHGYGDPLGYGPLRAQVALMLAERAIQVSPEQILLTFGANHGLDLIVRHLLRPGDTVLVDSPGYYPLFGKLKLARVEIIGVKRLPDGPDLDDLSQQIARHAPKAFFTQSVAHNPTGGAIALSVAHRLLQIATRHELFVIEDDPFADAVPASLPRLAALDQLERVIYLGTFSKTLSASLRIGYVAASPGVSRALTDMKMLTVVNSSGYLERTVSDLIASGQYRHHLRRLRERIGKATTRALENLERLGLPVFAAPTGGYYLWADFAHDVDDLALAKQASEQGIFIAPGSVFFPDRQQTRPGMRVNIAYADDPRLIRFLQSAPLSGLR